LNPLLRAAFLLHKREGWTHKEMAEELGISAETAKSRVYRARRQLREEMQFLT
jgi:RNA polymerase sigma factor (sigma-70 family)